MRLANVGLKMVGLFSAIFQSRPLGTIADWASGKSDPDGKPNIQLSTKESGDFAGGYDPDLNPLPTILTEVYLSGEYDKAVIKKSSQSGFTLMVLILICWFVSFVNRNFLYVIDSLGEMRRVSKDRLIPMLLGCRAAAGEIPEGEDGLNTLTLSLKRCVGYLAGAQSLGALSNKSVGLAIYDEVDAYPDAKKEQERAMELGSERGKKQTGFFEVWLSKPIHWDGPINQEYLIGTRHKAFVPCPHCDMFQELQRDRLRYDHCRDDEGAWDLQRILDETYYLCLSQECQESDAEGKILEHHKPEMVKRRDWRRTNFGQDEHKPQPRLFSCEVTDLYSTFPTATFGHLAKEWVESENDPSKRKRLLRGRFAEATKRKEVKTRGADIWSMTGEYARGCLPQEVDVVVMFVDVQGVVKKWVKCGFLLEDDTCFVIDYGECLSYGDCLVEADEPVRVLNWNEDTPEKARVNPTVKVGLIDEGYKQKEVRTWAVSTILPERLPDGSPAYRFYTSWGQGGVHARHLRDLVVPRLDDPPNATHEGFPIYAYRYSDDNFKDDLYNKRIGGHRAALAAKDEGVKPPANVAPLFFPADIDPGFVSELCQERFEFDPVTRRWGWPDVTNPNDYGDGVKCCLVAWYILKPGLAVVASRERANFDKPVVE
ncbi:MAG: phage terminase large subunit family protein [Verrucomicrobiota bacterium]